MNERIQELADQAEDYADSIVDQGGEFHSAYTDKLVELIVRECCNTILEFDYDYCTSPNKAMLDAAFDIKQRLGVKW